MGLLPLVVDKLRQDSKLHDANMSKSTFETKNVPAYSQFMFQYVYYCKQVYFQQEQSKLSGEIAFFSNLRKRGFQSGLNIIYRLKQLKMKKVCILVAIVATLSLVSCNNAQVKAEKARQDSIAEVARLDSIAKVQADSLRAVMAAAAAAAIDSLNQAVDSAATEIR